MSATPATALMMAALLMSPVQREVSATYVRNYDGDTVTLAAELVPGVVFQEINYRIKNIDTPEINGQCSYEKNLAVQSRKVVADLLRPPSARIKVHLSGEVDDHRRPLVLISINEEDLGQKLIRLDLARAWDGARRPWCPPIPATKPSNDK